jgi:adenosine deaminase
MPKAELHVHLEGTITPETLWAIAQRNHAALPVGSLAELRALYTFESFDRFLHLWLAMCGCLRRAEDYEQMADAFLASRGGSSRPTSSARAAPAMPWWRTRARPPGPTTSGKRCSSCAPAASSDPPFFGTDLTREYVLVHTDLGFSLPELWQINLNGLRYGLAETGLRRRLMREFEAAGAALGL